MAGAFINRVSNKTRVMVKHVADRCRCDIVNCDIAACRGFVAAQRQIIRSYIIEKTAGRAGGVGALAGAFITIRVVRKGQPAGPAVWVPWLTQLLTGQVIRTENW